MNPFALRDADRDAIADAVARGQRRIGALRNGGQAAARTAAEPRSTTIADELSMEGWRRRAVRWMLAHEADRVPSMFSLTELLVLGGGRPADFGAWGMSHAGVAGMRLFPLDAARPVADIARSTAAGADRDRPSRTSTCTWRSC